MSYGPALPPELLEARKSCTGNVDYIGPSLPPHYCREEDIGPSSNNNAEYVVGPELPPDFRRRSESEGSDVNKHESKVIYGPSPILPTGNSSALEKEDTGNSERKGIRRSVGPSLPPGFRVQERIEAEDDIIGPVPLASEYSEEDLVQMKVAEIEERAQRMKKELNNPSSTSVTLTRGDWMLKPPEVLSNVVTNKSRTFSKTIKEDRDTSVWTDTPADRERKARESKEKKRKREDDDNIVIPERDTELGQRVRDYNDKFRSQSLVQQHASNFLASKEVVDEAAKRPFDRDRDIGGNKRISASEAAKIIGKASELNTRFSRSTKGSTYL